MNPTVYIGMPVYNGERFIREAIESILSQTFSNWKLVISDDASTDATARIVSEYVKRDPRISYTRQEKNIGLFANFKYVLDDAQETYFMWAAQDDMWDSTFLETCVRILDTNKSIGLAGTNMVEIDSRGRVTRELLWLSELSGKPSVRSITHFILEPEILGKCNIIYGLWRTDAVKKVWSAYPQRKVWGQDYMFVLAAVARYEVRIAQAPLFKKRLGGYSSEGALDSDSDTGVQKRVITNPKDYIFPLGRFNSYFKGHREALSGTPYRTLGSLLLIMRLPRATLNYLKHT